MARTIWTFWAVVVMVVGCGGEGTSPCLGPLCGSDALTPWADTSAFDSNDLTTPPATDTARVPDHADPGLDLEQGLDGVDGGVLPLDAGPDTTLADVALADTSPGDLVLPDVEPLDLSTGEDGQACVPDCGNKQCGSDGCTGSCGGCDDGEDCTDDWCDGQGQCHYDEIGQSCNPVEPTHLFYDVVVVGAGTGGVSAAIEAARLGMKVALLERTDWLGGQMTAAAVTSMDEGHKNRDSGIYKEFIDQVKAHYAALGKAIGTCYWSNGTYCFEPNVGRTILENMVAAQGAKIDLYYRTTVTGVLVNGTVIGGVEAEVTTGNIAAPYVFHGQQTIDATEMGDVLALGPAPYRLGKGTSYAPDNGACIQDFTYTAVIRKYPGALPTGYDIAMPPPGYGPTVESHFKSIVTTNGAHWLTGPNDYPADWLTHVGYRGMPDSTGPGSYQSSQAELITRTGVNWANDTPISVGDLESGNWENVFCAGKLRTLQFIYYAQHVLGQSQWSLANDEGFSTTYQLQDNLCSNIPQNLKVLEQNLPVHPYVREGRRLIGMKLLTAKEIYREPPCPGCAPRALTTFPTSLAIGDYAVDLHGCNTNADLELALENEADVPPGFQGGAFQIPFEVFVPSVFDGLLAAEKNLSVSRLVNGAIRLQPITMLTGQAVGTMAAMAIAKGIQPRVLHPALVQDHLVSQGCMLAVWPFADVPRSHPNWADIQFVAAREVMMGYGEAQFAPDDDMSRAMMAVLMTRLFNIPVGPGPVTPTFGDVPKSHWGYDFIEALYAAGKTSGCSAEEMLYCPDDPLTKVAAAKFLMDGLGYTVQQASQNPYYTDVAPSHWSFPWVQLAAHHNIIGGCGGGKFCPTDAVLRRDMAKAARKIILLQVE